MALVYQESYTTRTHDLTEDRLTASREFYVFYDTGESCDDPDIVAADASLQTEFMFGAPHPQFWAVLFAKSLSIRQNETICILTVNYESLPGIDWEGMEVWEFDTMAEQRHITSVPNSTYITHYPAHDYGLAINATADSVEGVDVYRPKMSVQVTRLYDTGALVPWIPINDAACCVNAYPFPLAGSIIWDAGQVLFLGTNISESGGGKWQVVYRFSIGAYSSKEVTLLSGTTVYPTVAPHDYFWYRHGQKTATGPGGKTIMSPGVESCSVAQVYDYYDLNTFGLIGPV